MHAHILRALVESSTVHFDLYVPCACGQELLKQVAPQSYSKHADAVKPSQLRRQTGEDEFQNAPCMHERMMVCSRAWLRRYLTRPFRCLHLTMFRASHATGRVCRLSQRNVLGVAAQSLAGLGFRSRIGKIRVVGAGNLSVRVFAAVVHGQLQEASDASAKSVSATWPAATSGVDKGVVANAAQLQPVRDLNPQLSQYPRAALATSAVHSVTHLQHRESTSPHQRGKTLWQEQNSVQRHDKDVVEGARQWSVDGHGGSGLKLSARLMGQRGAAIGHSCDTSPLVSPLVLGTSRVAELDIDTLKHDFLHGHIFPLATAQADRVIDPSRPAQLSPATSPASSSTSEYRV